jgi:hypothetical protein
MTVVAMVVNPDSAAARWANCRMSSEMSVVAQT